MEICRGTYLAARPQEVPYIHTYIHTYVRGGTYIPCSKVHTMEMCSGTYIPCSQKSPRTYHRNLPWYLRRRCLTYIHTYIEVLRDRSRETQRASERHGRTERAREAQIDLERVREAERG